MKTTFADTLILCAVLALFAVTVNSFTSCALFSGSATTDAKLAEVQNLSYAAASLGTSEALLQNPGWFAQFSAAEAQLNQLITQKTVTGDLLRKVIASLPVRELKSPQARIAITTATTLFDSLAGTSVNVEKTPYLLAAATGIRDGIQVALSNTTTIRKAERLKAKG